MTIACVYCRSLRGPQMSTTNRKPHSAAPSHIQWIICIIFDKNVQMHASVMVCSEADLTAQSAWQQGIAAHDNVPLHLRPKSRHQSRQVVESGGCWLQGPCVCGAQATVSIRLRMQMCTLNLAALASAFSNSNDWYHTTNAF